MNRTCEDCGVIINYTHGRTKRCEHCNTIYKNEYMRQYMAKYNLKKRWDQMSARTDGDKHVLNSHHMIGLGTFVLTKSRGNDFKKEYDDIRKLKRLAGI